MLAWPYSLTGRVSVLVSVRFRDEFGRNVHIKSNFTLLLVALDVTPRHPEQSFKRLDDTPDKA